MERFLTKSGKDRWKPSDWQEADLMQCHESTPEAIVRFISSANGRVDYKVTVKRAPGCSWFTWLRNCSSACFTGLRNCFAACFTLSRNRLSACFLGLVLITVWGFYGGGFVASSGAKKK